jgi:hypothetical protein
MANKKKVDFAWTEDEIVRSYKEAMNPIRQIGVLADLNACTQAQICGVLKRAGLKLPVKPAEAITKTETRRRKARAAAGFAYGKKILLERNGRMYSVGEVAKIHEKSENWIRVRARGTDICVIGDTEYVVHRYQNGIPAEGK